MNKAVLRHLYRGHSVGDCFHDGDSCGVLCETGGHRARSEQKQDGVCDNESLPKGRVYGP